MADEHNIEITIAPLFQPRTRPGNDELCNRIADAVQKPRTAVIISFEGFLDHWTVIRRVTSATFELFDSVGLTRAKRQNVRMVYSIERPHARAHIVARDAVFVVLGED